MDEDKMTIGLIGAGGMGKRWAGVLANHQEVDFRVVADVDAERAKAIAEPLNVTSTGDIDEVIQNNEIQAVVIVVPHKFLAGVTAFALNAGKHVLSEKPGALTVAELEPNIQLAKYKNLCFMVGFNHRFHPSHQVAKKLVSEGKIGTPQFMRAVYGFGGRPGYEKEWRHNKEMSGGGELIDQGVHLIDLARWFLGDIVEAKGMNADLFWHSEVEDNAFMLLKTKDRRVASLHASWSEWKPTYRLELYGSDGYLRIEGLGRKYGGTEKVFVGRRTEKFGASEEEVIECDPNADNSLKDEISEFMTSIREGRSPEPSAEDGLAALKIVEEIYQHEKE